LLLYPHYRAPSAIGGRNTEALMPLLPDQWNAANPKYLLPVNR
jgi:hypothetical protein